MVQDGLSTSVVMFLKGLSVFVGMVIMMILYNWKAALIACALITPQIVSSRVYWNFARNINERYQENKGELGAHTQETFSNVKTIKSFAIEENSCQKFEGLSQVVFKTGVSKATYFGIWIGSNQVVTHFAFGGFLWIMASMYVQEGLTIGELTATLLYMKKITQNFGEITNGLQQIAKVYGASYQIAEMIVKEPKVVFKKDGEKVSHSEGALLMDKV